MEITSARILRTYVTLTLLSTFASSFIWGINTLFLLDAGLSVAGAFAVNAFFTVGQVLFEVPTGVVADTMGRRTSYLLGSATLFVGTLLYLWMWWIHGPFWAWALSSILLGLGFTFFSGATEAWLVDGLTATGYRGPFDAAFAKGQIAEGVGMLTGTVAGGVIAQLTNLGVPFALRAAALLLTFVVAYVSMHDVGFQPRRGASVAADVRAVLRASINYGFGNPPVRWLMLGGLVSGGVPMFAFYAMQPYLLEQSGRQQSYAIAGVAAALFAGAQIAGGYLVPAVSRWFARRTSALLAAAVVSAVCLAVIGAFGSFWISVAMLALWAISWASIQPIRQAFLNGCVPSAQRATLLSFDNLLQSAGGVVAQPVLGRVADLSGYAASYLVSAVVELLSLPLLLLARRERSSADPLRRSEADAGAAPTPARPPTSPWSCPPVDPVAFARTPAGGDPGRDRAGAPAER